MIKDYKGAKLYYLPWYDKENTTFIDLARVIDLAFRVLQEKIDIVDRNLFIDTALEALDLYQRDLGLQISEEVSIEQKRKIIQGYLHYLHEQTTEEVVRELCKSFENVTSDIDIEKALATDTYNVNVNYTFGHKVDYKSLDTLLQKILPAHLSYIMNIIAKTYYNIYVGIYSVIDREKTMYQRLQSEFEKEHKYYQGMANILLEKEITYKFPEVYFLKDDGINVKEAKLLNGGILTWGE